MSHQIIYAITEQGEKAWRALGSPALFGVFWELGQPAAPSELLADFEGALTFVWLPQKYSALIVDDESTLDLVERVEAFLVNNFPDSSIIRFDEVLYDDWTAKKGELWHQDPTVAAEFLEWLRAQDPLHWKEIRNVPVVTSSLGV